ncbi:MAG: amidohydrolase [Hyphomicrobiales bacterium]|nr:MAG: amidohydrolase [Hyphomicrobiales bacterium]
MLEWRHDLHCTPELGFEEYDTAQFIAEKLQSFGIEVHEKVGGTGVVGVLRRGDGQHSIGLRADMDALPITEQSKLAYRSVHEGRMHACGHDGHMTMLLGAACHLAKKGAFDGTAVFIFQPDEENGRGAKAMIDDGLFERFPIDIVYAIHNLPGLESGRIAVKSGPIMACEDTFKINITGKGAHAAMPHRGIDPIVIGAEIVTALQTIVSRTLDPLDNAVVSITDFCPNGARNTIPDSVTLSGDVRSFSPAVQNRIEKTMQRIVAGICAAHGARQTVQYHREYTATVNTQREAGIVAEQAVAAHGGDMVNPDCLPLMASDDFGLMLRARPGAYFFLGNGVTGASGRSLHNPGYDFNDDILATGAQFWVRMVQTQLSV